MDLANNSSINKTIKKLCLAAVLIAMGHVIGFFTFFMPGFPQKISLGFLVAGACGYLLGPYAAICGALGDVLGFISRSQGNYIWGFTVTAALGHLIYGLFLHKKKASLLRCFFACLVVISVVNLTLNTLCCVFWLNANKSFQAIFIGRLIANAIFLVTHPPLMFAILKSLEQLQKRLPILQFQTQD